MKNLPLTYDQNNIFAKIIKNEFEAVKIFENNDNLVIMDIMPQSKGHSLVIPKYPARNIFDVTSEALQETILLVQKIAQASIQAFKADGVAIMQYNESAAGQTVFHLHFHIVPKYKNKNLIPHAQIKADIKELKNQANALAHCLNAIMF